MTCRRAPNALTALLIATCGCALPACGGTSVTGIADPVAPRVTITLTAPTTTTVRHPRVGDTLVCKSGSATVRGKIPPPGQLNKGVGHAAPNGSSSSAQLQATWRQGHPAVVVSCKP
jgi:hypothetical protein